MDDIYAEFLLQAAAVLRRTEAYYLGEHKSSRFTCVAVKDAVDLYDNPSEFGRTVFALYLDELEKAGISLDGAWTLELIGNPCEITRNEFLLMIANKWELQANLQKEKSDEKDQS